MIRARATPSVLLWARNSSGYSLEDVAKKLASPRISPENIEEWERGDNMPTYAQLEKLADYYKRPVALFFFPEPPEEDGIEQKFRSLPSDEALKLSPSVRYLVRSATATQMDLRDLHENNFPDSFRKFIERVDIHKRNPQILATEVRKIIGVTLQQQFGWRSEEVAIKNWRTAIENFGIWVFKRAFKDDSCCGFCLNDAHFPVIYVNNSMSKRRQIFTLFHELSHLITGYGGVYFRSDMEGILVGNYKREEVFCNAFAGSFLVPEIPEDAQSSDDSTISNYAEKYKVSRDVILRRYLDGNKITRERYKEITDRWKKYRENNPPQKASKNSGGGDYYATQKAYLGEKYMNLVFSKYYNHQIDEYQLADYLGMKLKSLATFERHFHRGEENQ